jgi:hypothetical protein
METRDFPESDWKTFRELREVALQRFCQRVLDQVEPLCRDASQSPYERYLVFTGYCGSEIRSRRTRSTIRGGRG